NRWADAINPDQRPGVDVRRVVAGVDETIAGRQDEGNEIDDTIAAIMTECDRRSKIAAMRCKRGEIKERKRPADRIELRIVEARCVRQPEEQAVLILDATNESETRSAGKADIRKRASVEHLCCVDAIAEVEPRQKRHGLPGVTCKSARERRAGGPRNRDII